MSAEQPEWDLLGDCVASDACPCHTWGEARRWRANPPRQQKDGMVSKEVGDPSHLFVPYTRVHSRRETASGRGL